MPNKKFLMVIAIGALILSSCTMSYPGTNATPIPTNPFTKPMATDKMTDLQKYATGTAMEKTAIAEGKPTSTLTPEGVEEVDVTPSITPTPGGSVTEVTATNTSALGGFPTFTLVPVTGRPAQYTLQAGEFPYCIARRFNVDPYDLLALSGLTLDQANSLDPGTVLKIPQSGSFPGTRALRPHPTTYTVTSSDETFYSIACLFGDVDPSQIAQANGIALGTFLATGKVLNIP